MPPVSLPPGLTAYLTYILASLRDVHPELGLDAILTATGKKYVTLAENTRARVRETARRRCHRRLPQRSALLAPGWRATISAYMAMPESGFDKPLFMGRGLIDLDVPFAIAAPYIAVLQANRQPLTLKTYASDHSGTLIQSQADSIPFLGGHFAPALREPSSCAARSRGPHTRGRSRLARESVAGS